MNVDVDLWLMLMRQYLLLVADVVSMREVEVVVVVVVPVVGQVYRYEPFA